jgi:electron transfer flavoprotein alpha subunit
MSVLVIAEHDHHALKSSTLHTITAASRLGDDVHVLVAGANAGNAAQAAAQVAGVAKVLHADAPYLESQTAENVAAQALSVIAGGGYTHVLAPASGFGKNALPRIAAKLDVAQISDITGIESPTRSCGRSTPEMRLPTVQSIDPVKVLTVRGTAFDVAGSGGSAPVATVTPAPDAGKSKVIGQELTQSARPELTGARVVISGGRGLGSGENFKLLERWPTSSTRDRCVRAPPWTPAMCRTTIRWGRPEKLSHRTCTSRSESRARSSIWPG